MASGNMPLKETIWNGTLHSHQSGCKKHIEILEDTEHKAEKNVAQNTIVGTL